MGGHLTGLDHLISQQTSNWIRLVLKTPLVLWAGWPFFVRGWQSVVTRNLNMFTLIAMGTGVAWIYSVVATLAPGVFPAAFRGPTARERDVLREMAAGKSNEAIGESLFLAERSVEKVIHSIFLKLELTWEPSVNKRVKAVILYLAESD